METVWFTESRPMLPSFVVVDPPGLGVLAMLLLVLLVILWFLIAIIFALRGGVVDTPNRVAQLYGYTVCLVALIVALTTLATLIDAAFERAYPLQDEHGVGPSLGSFEAYQATFAPERMMMF